MIHIQVEAYHQGAGSRDPGALAHRINTLPEKVGP